MRSRNLPRQWVQCSTLICASILAVPVNAKLLDDSSARLELRNYYFNRDYREGTAPPREEWAQGFLLHLDSGFTEGRIGVGADAIGMLGIKLDSAPGRSGTGLLKVARNGRAEDDYWKLALAGKLKASKTQFKFGALVPPTLPTLKPNDGRLFPQVFEGGLLTSNEIDDLELTAGRLSRVMQRNATEYTPLTLSPLNRRFQGQGATAEHFDMAGIDYRFHKQWLARVHVAQLEDIYRQQVFTLVGKSPWGPGTFSGDLRLSLMNDYGDAKGGKIDNRALQGMLGYAYKGHSLGLTYQRMLGDTGYANILGADANLINLSILGDFANAKERSWALRYGYDFASLGLPGLSLNSRYISGSHAQITGTRTIGKSWELDNELRYVVQQGPLKNLSVRLRSALYRSNYAKNFIRDTDDTRLMFNYSWNIK
ncbi:outer membrane porin, OprD family [Pseudomonas sp. TKO26]|uniref:OprD family porin n=1 Tax=unclassified Pseudomonas TaxID=196821 RepID=UPI000D9AF9CE|nr:outer membrane porin, OprD family [Pseudomonas sp. TKO30]PYY93520.1 outer membrane porin, OprD family [Pseudomonas sp. TKO29]PYY95748.1 outer membrane porin, OprD family [Pseudomonas sp. TKO26]PYZ01679.1 outer membrane porin, OprD family [Pseudomonas sp. TKO14]